MQKDIEHGFDSKNADGESIMAENSHSEMNTHEAPFSNNHVIIEFDDSVSAATSSSMIDAHSRRRRRTTDPQLKKNQASMTILHYVLTYARWSFTLFFVLARCSLPLPSAYESVTRPLADLRAIARQESELYYECTVDAFDKVEDELFHTAQIRTALLQDQQLHNQQVVTKVEFLADEAVNQTRKLRSALQILSHQSLRFVVNEADSCSAQDLVNLTQWIGLDENKTLVSELDPQGAIVQALDSYLLQSQSTLRHVTNYTQERSTYDYHYFVGIKIQATVDALELANPSIQLTIDQMALLEQLKVLLQAILDALRDSYIRVSLLTLRVEDFYASLLQFHAKYLDLYDRLLQTSFWVTDFLPEGRSLPEFLNLDGIPSADFLLPDVFEVPSFPTMLPNIDMLIADYIKEALKVLAQLVAELAREATEQTKLALEILMEKLKELLTLDDYDPPQYSRRKVSSIEEENGLLEEQGKETKQATEEALWQVKTPEVTPLEAAAPTAPEEQMPTYSSTLVSNTTATFDYIQPSFPSFSIPGFLEALLVFLSGNNWIIELVVQLVRLFRLRRKYERDVLPDLPAVNYKADQDDDEDEKEQQSQGNLALMQVAFLKSFMTPWMALGLILFPFAMVGVLLWFPYVKAQCLDSKDGTFVARNLVAPVLINRANVAGFNHHIKADLHCRRTQRQYCHDIYAGANILHRRHSLAWDAAQERFNKSMHLSNVAEGCLKLDFLDQDMMTACCGLEGYDNYTCASFQNESQCPIDYHTGPPQSFRPLSEYVTKGSSLWDEVLEPQNDECINAEVCQTVACAGVDGDRIRHWAIEADCRVETYVIFCCIYLLLAVYHAIMWNLSCTLAFEGIKRLVWRRLRPSGIRFQTHVTEDGQLVQGDNLDERVERIRRAMQRFERMGKVQCGLSGLIFLIWFVSFWTIKRLLAARLIDYL